MRTPLTASPHMAYQAIPQSVQPGGYKVSICFHCNLPVSGTAYPVVVDGVSRDTCCRGCQAVAELIAGNGLTAYYRQRTAPAVAAGSVSTPGEDFTAFDLPEVQHPFVREFGAEREASLLLEGLTCGACVWLIEQRLMRLPGVSSVIINYASRRARVRWNPGSVLLSDILSLVSDLGYGARPYDPARADDRFACERRSMLWRLFVAGMGMMQVMMYAVPVYLADGQMTPDIENLMRWASLLLTTPVVVWASTPFYSGAWRELRARRLGMDMPVALSVVIAYAASVYATLIDGPQVYFDSVSMFVFLLLCARYLEMNARGKASEAQESLVRLVPATTERFDAWPDRSRLERVPVARLSPGDHVLVRPGDGFPADGIVIEGDTATDESLLTGESRPVPRRAGDHVTGGALNLRSPVTIRVEQVGEGTVLAGIVRLMDRAQGEKPQIALSADRAARIFVAVLLVLTPLVAAVWAYIEPGRALWIALSVLIVSCPCALSLATPAALTAATGALYRKGVLISRGHALETLARATHVVFDKTGTLTEGRLALVGVLGARAGEIAPIDLAAALERHSEHPIARALVHGARGVPQQATGVRQVPGCGIEGCVNGRLMRIGTVSWVAELHGRQAPPELGCVSDEMTLVAMGDVDGWMALFTFGDRLRADARRVVQELKATGRTVMLLSGDRGARVEQVARELGCDTWRGDATPEMKLAVVSELQKSGATVAMVGDGINDAPVLAQADVSFAMSSGTALAQTSADVAFLSDRLPVLLDTVSMARRTLAIIRENLAWAALYNAVALPLAMTGHLTPLAAAIGMSTSSLIVVGNTLRLLRRSTAGTAVAGTPCLRAFV